MPNPASRPRKTLQIVSACLLCLAWLGIPWLFWGANRVAPNQVPLRHLKQFGQPLGFTQDGQAFLTYAFNRATVAIWSVRSGEKLVEFHSTECPWPHGVVLSPNRSTFVARVFGTPLVIRDATTGIVQRELLSQDHVCEGVAYSRDGQTLAIGDEGKIRLWDCSTATDRTTLESPTWARLLIFSPDGKTLVASDWCWRATLFDLEKGRQSEFELPNTNGIAFGPSTHFAFACRLAVADEAVVLGQGCSSELIVRDTATGQQRSKHEIKGELKSLAISPDGQVVATCQLVRNAIAAKLIAWNLSRWTSYFPDYHGAVLLDAASGQELAWIPGPTEAVFLADGHTLAGFCPDDSSIRLWSVPPRRALPSYVPWSAAILVTALSGLWWRWRGKGTQPA